MRKKQRKTISKTHRKTISQNSSVNRKYKDTLFRMIFRDRKNLLSLYNALNNSSYTDPDEMEITTLEDVIYVGRLGCQKAYLKAAFYLYLENLTRLCREFIKGSIGE